jgi:transposase
MHPNRERQTQRQTDGWNHPAVLFVSLELSRSTWLVTSLSPGSEKMSRHATAGGDGPALLALLARLRKRAEEVTGATAKVVVIQEAGLDGFWIHRLLETNDIASYVVDHRVDRRAQASAAREDGCDRW